MKNKILNIIGCIAVILSVVVAVFVSKEKKMQIGIKPENMDLNVKPGQDFYDFATAGWRKNNPLPDDYVRFGSFETIDKANNERVREILENNDGKIGTLYKMAMDMDKLNADKTAPVAPLFAEIDNIKTTTDLIKYMGKNQKYINAFWDDGVILDDKDSTHYIFVITQGGIGLNRDYYFDDDEKSVEIRNKYREYIQKQSDNFGLNLDANKIYAIEERMAKSFFEKEKLRDPLSNYHKKSMQELRETFSNFDWDTYFDARGAKPEFVNVMQIEPISESIAIINDTDMDTIKQYLKLRIINMSTQLLDKKTFDIGFDFFNRTMAGQKEQKPRWKFAVGLVDGAMGEETGRIYVEKYFPESAKKRMEKLVANLQRALEMRIKNLDWMGENTRRQALKKLHTFRAKIGYPDKWRDYSDLEIKNDSLIANVMRADEFEDAFWLNKIGKEKDSTIWYMNAHTVNAYYDPSTNEICFPAGILQYPFFDMNSDDAFNYGAIGSIIGHEMTHGFDDSGRHYDSDGNMVEWWDESDAARFTEHANVMVKHFDNIIVAPNTHANGKFTLGENLADYGGVTVAYTAYKNFGEKSESALGLTPDQRFFIAYAMTEATNMTDAALLRQTKTNEHSLGRWRVNGILPHVDAWYDVFNVTPDDKMYISPENRVNLW